MGRFRFIGKILVACLVAAGLGIVFLGGYSVGRYEIQPFSLVQKVEKRLLGNILETTAFALKEAARGDGVQTQQVDSIFFRLSSEAGKVATEMSGGGLASFGDTILLLTGDGEVFSARSAHEINKTNIQVPDNGLAAYRQVADLPQYRELIHDFGRFRYHDILHAQWGQEQALVISYSDFDEEGMCYGTTVAMLTLGPEVQSVEQINVTEEDWEILFRTKPCLPLKSQSRAIEGHLAGGRIAFGAPATVYLGSGDYAWDGIYAPEAIAQDPDSDYGKVIAIDLASRQAETVSIGHRNMQGVAVDRDNQLWVVEHGMRGGDELNRVLEGANYGWPEETLGTKYNLLPVDSASSYGRHDKFTAPTYAWLPSVAISSLSRIERFHTSWDGDLLMGSLKDQSLYRIRIGDDHVRFAERIEVGRRIRYALTHNDGRLVLWTDDLYLMFLSVAEQNFVDQFIGYYIKDSDYSDAQRNQIRVALDSCLECHSFVPNSHAKSPSLALMFEAPIGSTTYQSYSASLKTKSGDWSRSELKTFLDDPAAYAPGTTMPDPGIDDPFVLDELINIMEAAKQSSE